jgi:hypothetical protein
MKFVAAALTIAFSLVAVDGVGQRENVVYGLGLRSCGQWIEAKPETTITKRMNRVAMTAWVTGFVTAAGMYSQVNLPNTDVSGMTVWVDTYCAANPLAPFSHAGVALVYDLNNSR